MAFIQGTGRDVGAWLLMLAYSYGSPNWLQGGLTGNSCYHPRLGAMKVVQGDYAAPDCGQFLPGRYDDPDFRLPQVIIVWGYNPPAVCTDGFRGRMGFTGNLMDPEVFFEKRVGAREYPITRNFHWRAHPDVLVDQMFSGDPYPIKGAWVAGNNFLVDGANPRRLLEAFNRLDLVVVTDLFMTPTAAALADYVLPGATFAEREGVRAWWAPLNAINRAITVAECKGDAEICFELAKRFNPRLPWQNLREFFDHLLKPAGVT